MLENGQWMLRQISPWLHAHRFHILPSVGWLALVVLLATWGIAFAYIWGRERPAMPPEPYRLFEPVTALTSPALPVIASSLTHPDEAILRVLLPAMFQQIKRTPIKSGASLSHVSERQPFQNMSMNNILENLALKGLEAALAVYTANETRTLDILSQTETKLGTALVSVSDAIIVKEVPAYLSFLNGDFEAGVTGEEQTLISEAGSENQALYDMGLAYLTSRIAALKAIVGTSPAPAAKPASAPSPSLLSAVEYKAPSDLLEPEANPVA
jgi:hypothetical protein